MVPSGVPDGSIPYARAAFSAEDEVADLEVVLCAPEEADADLENAEHLKGRLAVARRGGCSFQEKTERVERAGARGLVIINTDDALFTAAAPGFSAGIPVVMIRATHSAALIAAGSSSILRPMSQAGPTAEQVLLLKRLGELQAARDWLGLCTLEREALVLARDLRGVQPHLAGAIHGVLGVGLDGVGQYARALELHAEHRAMAEALGDRAGVATACGNLGNCYKRTGQFARALELYAECKEVFEELENHAGVALSCVNLGNCYRSTGLYARALELHAQHKKMTEEMGDLGGVAQACGNMGSCYMSMGQYARALELHAEHRAMAEALGDREGVAMACGNLGSCYMSMGQYSLALGLHAEHKAMAEALGDRAGVAAACCNLGCCYECTGQYVRALALHAQHKKMAEELGNRAGVATACCNLGNCYIRIGQYARALELHAEHKAMAEDIEDRAGVAKAYGSLGICYERTGQYVRALELHAEHKSMVEALGDRAGVAAACCNLGNCYFRTGQYSRALELHAEYKAMAEELGDSAGVGTACNNLGITLEKTGDLPGAARALVQGLAAYQRVERDVGAHDDRRVSLFEEQQKTYMLLQSMLLGLGQPGWALGVAARAKARALAHRLGGGSHDEIDAAAAAEGAYAKVCGAWWADVQELARCQAAAAAGSTMCVLEYSLLDAPDRLAIWALSEAGELLGSATMPTTAYRRDAMGRVVFADGLARMNKSSGARFEHLSSGGKIRSLLEEARGSMKVRGRDTLVSGSALVSGARAEQLPDAGDEPGTALRAKKCKSCKLDFNQCVCQTTKTKETTVADEARERVLLRELYAALVAPVEEHLAGAEEVLIVPHKELFEVPWAALIDAHGHFLIERHVLRVAPSLRVADQAAGKAAQRPAQQRPGHVVLVGNPRPTRLSSLPFAEDEVNAVEGILNRAEMQVLEEHFFRSNCIPRATKGRVKRALEGAGWVHLALHGDIDTDSLVLAVPDSSDPDHAQPDLSMLEVQGSDEAADKREGVRLGEGATVVLSACNTGRGEIKAEGVVGLARGFLLAGAAAAVVSLWSVDDGSTAALMEQMYQHLVEGCTVPQALRLAMLRLARRPTLHQPVSEKDVVDGLLEAWKRPMHWAGFLVMGASTRLIRIDSP
jgi:CHAT domain-containing protein/tetratricopeptide (TPR) repeat protein